MSKPSIPFYIVMGIRKKFLSDYFLPSKAMPQRDGQTDGRNWKNNIALCMLGMLTRDKKTVRAAEFWTCCNGVDRANSELQ